MLYFDYFKPGACGPRQIDDDVYGVIYRIRGLFGSDFNLAVRRIFVSSPNLNHAVLTRRHEMN